MGFLGTDFLLSSLGKGVLGGRLMLGYQKSLPAQYTLTQTANSSFSRQKLPSTTLQKNHNAGQPAKTNRVSFHSTWVQARMSKHAPH